MFALLISPTTRIMNNYSSKRHLFFLDGHLDKRLKISYICSVRYVHIFALKSPPGGLFGFKEETARANSVVIQNKEVTGASAPSTAKA